MCERERGRERERERERVLLRDAEGRYHSPRLIKFTTPQLTSTLTNGSKNRPIALGITLEGPSAGDSPRASLQDDFQGLGPHFEDRKTRRIASSTEPHSMCDHHGGERRVLPLHTVFHYRGTSLIRNSANLGPYSRAMPRALSWS